jgi:hypothetical protein
MIRVGVERSSRVGLVSRSSLPMFAVCLGALLPWGRAPRSGVVGEGRYAFALALAGLLVYALAATRDLDPRWWRFASVPLALGCLSLAVIALNGYGALGALVAAVASVAWLAAARRRHSSVGSAKKAGTTR